MSGAQPYRKTHQRGKLVKANTQDALNILKNAQIASTSSLVAHQDLFAVPYPDHNHPDLCLDNDMEPTSSDPLVLKFSCSEISFLIHHSTLE